MVCCRCACCYIDPERGRPGLPADVAALVDTVEPDRTGLQLVNLSATQTRRVIVQAGSFGTDRIDEAVRVHRHR